MPLHSFTPATMPAPDRPDPLLLFIQRALVTIYYRENCKVEQIRALRVAVPET